MSTDSVSSTFSWCKHLLSHSVPSIPSACSSLWRARAKKQCTHFELPPLFLIWVRVKADLSSSHLASTGWKSYQNWKKRGGGGTSDASEWVIQVPSSVMDAQCPNLNSANERTKRQPEGRLSKNLFACRVEDQLRMSLDKKTLQSEVWHPRWTHSSSRAPSLDCLPVLYAPLRFQVPLYAYFPPAHLHLTEWRLIPI